MASTWHCLTSYCLPVPCCTNIIPVEFPTLSLACWIEDAVETAWLTCNAVVEGEGVPWLLQLGNVEHITPRLLPAVPKLVQLCPPHLGLHAGLKRLLRQHGSHAMRWSRVKESLSTKALHGAHGCFNLAMLDILLPACSLLYQNQFSCVHHIESCILD